MVEQLFADYDKFGGSLDEETYDGLRRLVGDMKINPIPVKIDQHTGVMITPEEELVYSQLSKGVLGRFLGVQPLMAEAMLVVMGNSKNREIYMRGYSPHIDFRIDLMQRSAPKPDQGVRQITLRPTTETVIFARG